MDLLPDRARESNASRSMSAASFGSKRIEGRVKGLLVVDSGSICVMALIFCN